MPIYSLESVSLIELIVAASMILPTIVFCWWQQRPFLLWVIHALMIQYLCLYWIDMPFTRVGIGLVVTVSLVLFTEKRTVNSL